MERIMYAQLADMNFCIQEGFFRPQMDLRVPIDPRTEFRLLVSFITKGPKIELGEEEGAQLGCTYGRAFYPNVTSSLRVRADACVGAEVPLNMNFFLLSDPIVRDGAPMRGMRNCSKEGCGCDTGPQKWCRGCRDARYCSEECQRADWSRHKDRCERLRQAREGLAGVIRGVNRTTILDGTEVDFSEVDFSFTFYYGSSS
eukprot:5128149-Prorocentrum_lima.AAC.1